MHLLPWLDPANLIEGFGAYALLGVAIIIFAETGLLIGFLFPGDTLLILTGVLAISGTFKVHIAIVCAVVSLAAFLGGEVGYFIGHKAGPRIFEKRESGLFSKKNVERTNAFFVRFGPIAVILARFVPVVRTFAPIAARSLAPLAWPVWRTPTRPLQKLPRLRLAGQPHPPSSAPRSCARPESFLAPTRRRSPNG